MSDRGEYDAVTGGIERMAELVMSEQTVQTVVDLIVDLTRTAICVADGASITLRRQDRLVTVATTIPHATTLDDVQTKRGGGPGMQATLDDQTVAVRDLSRDERWPHFARAAMDEGFKSVLAIPLNPVSEAIGALVLYSSTGDAFDAETEQLATRLARQAAIAIANSGSFVDSEESNEQLREALASRDVIGQAKGILMERSNLTADEAFDEMRAASQRDNRKLRNIAEDIVAKVRTRNRS